MKGFLGVFLLLGAMVSGESRADLLQPNYLLDVEASLAVGLDGAVTDVDVRGIDDEMVLARVVERLEGWTFDITPGAGAQAESYAVTARFQLVAVADGEHMLATIRQPKFSTRPIGASPRSEDWSYGGQTVQRTPIQHPASSVGHGGRGTAFLETEIVVLVAFGPDGRVLQTGVRSIDLFDVEVRESEQAQVERILRPYVDAATRGLRRWRFPEATGEEPPAVRQVLVPVHFATVGGSRKRQPGQWRYALSVDSMVDDWARPRGGESAVAAFDEISEEIDQRLVLLATEDDLVL